jgi:hypothetical protein
MRSNTIKVSRAIVESVLLSAIQRDLFTEEGFMYFEQESRSIARRTLPKSWTKGCSA